MNEFIFNRNYYFVLKYGYKILLLILSMDSEFVLSQIVYDMYDHVYRKEQYIILEYQRSITRCIIRYIFVVYLFNMV